MKVNSEWVFRTFLSGLFSIILTATLFGEIGRGIDAEVVARERKVGDSLKVIYPSSPIKLPVIKFIDDQGNEIELDKFKNSFVALHFWAIWCSPCRKELPTMDKLQTKFSEKNFVIVPLSVGRDDTEDVRKFYEENKIDNLSVYVDPTMKSARALLVTGIPFTILIDRKGREVGRVVGERDWSSPDVYALLREIIQ